MGWNPGIDYEQANGWYRPKPSGGPSVPARVASNSGIHQNGNATASTTVSVTLPSTVGSGNMLTVWVGTPATSVTGVSDDIGGNTYTAGPTIRDATNGYTWSAFYCLNVVNSPQTIQATVSSSTQFSTILVDGFSGVLGSGALDVTGAANIQLSIPSGTVITSGLITTVSNGDLVVGATVNLGGSGTLAVGTGFTAGLNSSPDFFSEYQVQSTAGSIEATFTHTTTEGFITGIMAFKHA